MNTQAKDHIPGCPFCGSDARTDAGMGFARCSSTACELGAVGAQWITIETWSTRAPISTGDWEKELDDLSLPMYDEKDGKEVEVDRFVYVSELIPFLRRALSASTITEEDVEGIRESELCGAPPNMGHRPEDVQHDLIVNRICDSIIALLRGKGGEVKEG